MSEFYSFKYFLDNEFKNWDPDKFDWVNESKNIAKNCNKYFNIWWNKDKFNWKEIYYLFSYCYKKFKIWWDPNKFDWSNIHCVFLLVKRCSKYFDMWWDKNKFQGRYYFILLFHCFELIDKWWDLDIAVKYFKDSEVDYLVKKNNRKNAIDKAEIIKLKLLRS